MDDIQYNVFITSGSEGELKVLLAEETVTEIDDAVLIGNINHTTAEDDLGVKDNHVLYQHIREMLYHVDREGNSSFWPDNVTDISRLTIEVHVPEPEPDPVPEGP